MTQREREENLHVFHALDHEKRLEILAYLADYGEADFDMLSKHFDMSGRYLSHHLKVLLGAKLIDSVWSKPEPEKYNLSEKSVKMLEKYSEFNKNHDI